MKKPGQILFLNFFVLALFSLLNHSCTLPELNEAEADKFYISFGEFETYEEAELFKSKRDIQLWRELKIKQIEEKRFLLLYGIFNSSFSAGKKGFELHTKSLVSNFKIFNGSSYVHDDFNNVMFTARYQGRPSVFNFNLITKRVNPVWSRWGRKVISLRHGNNNANIFFTTALGYGRQGSFPYVRDPRLYIYSDSAEQVDEIDEFGNCLQLYTYWENRDTFKVNITKPDSINTERLVQKIYSYDAEGKHGTSKTRSFSLIKEGFPKPPLIKPDFISPQKSMQIRTVQQDSESFVYLKNLSDNSEVMICSFSGKLLDAEWSRDDRLLFLRIGNKIPFKKSFKISYELMVIDTGDKQIIRSFNNPKFQNIFVHGLLLFFDDVSSGYSKINLFDCLNDTVYHVIEIPGGCGINSLQ